MLDTLLKSLIKHVVQVDVGQQRTYDLHVTVTGTCLSTISMSWSLTMA